MSLEWVTHRTFACGYVWEDAFSRMNLSQDTSTQSVFFVGMAGKTEMFLTGYLSEIFCVVIMGPTGPFFVIATRIMQRVYTVALDDR